MPANRELIHHDDPWEEATPPNPARRLRTNRFLGAIFGVAGPLLCFGANARLGEFFPFHNSTLYAFIGIEIAWLVVWLARPATRPLTAAVSAGVFAFGTLFAGAVGFLLAPLSVLMIFSGIGILGLIPLGTAFIFGRLTKDAWNVAQIEQVPSRLFALTLGAGIAIAPSLASEGAQTIALRVASERLRDSDDLGAIDSAQRALEAVPWFDDERLVTRWQSAGDPGFNAKLDELYRRRNGHTISDELEARAD